MAAIPVSIGLGAPISTSLLELDGVLGIAGWRWLFLCEAAPAVIFGVATFFYLPTGRRRRSGSRRKSGSGWRRRWKRSGRRSRRTGSADRSTTVRPCQPATAFNFRRPLARGRARGDGGEVLALLPVAGRQG